MACFSCANIYPVDCSGLCGHGPEHDDNQEPCPIPGALAHLQRTLSGIYGKVPCGTPTNDHKHHLENLAGAAVSTLLFTIKSQEFGHAIL